MIKFGSPVFTGYPVGWFCVLLKLILEVLADLKELSLKSFKVFTLELLGRLEFGFLRFLPGDTFEFKLPFA